MTAPAFNSWDGDPVNGISAYRPGVGDMGGDQLENDTEAPPTEGEEPTAEAWNQIVKQVSSLGRVASSAKLDVQFSAGVPTVIAVSAASPQITTATFTVVDNGVGDTSITAPAGKLPGRITNPSQPHIKYSGAPGGIQWGLAEVITNGIRVRTYVGTTPTDLPFGVYWD